MTVKNKKRFLKQKRTQLLKTKTCFNSTSKLVGAEKSPRKQRRKKLANRSINNLSTRKKRIKRRMKEKKKET